MAPHACLQVCQLGATPALSHDCPVPSTAPSCGSLLPSSFWPCLTGRGHRGSLVPLTRRVVYVRGWHSGAGSWGWLLGLLGACNCLPGLLLGPRKRQLWRWCFSRGSCPKGCLRWGSSTSKSALQVQAHTYDCWAMAGWASYGSGPGGLWNV